ncbi:SCO family protein [Rhodopirellula sp.]|nr:SCO family protein [Rhodopirellula sp.]
MVSLLTIFGGHCAVGQGGLQNREAVSLNDSIPREVRDVTVEQKLGASIPLNLSLIDSEGREIESGYVINGQKPVIVTLNYSDCPMLCNVQLSQLSQTLSKLDLKIGEDFEMLTVSIDPKESSELASRTKKKFAEPLVAQHPNVSEGWTFCTSDFDTISLLSETLGFSYSYNEKTGEYYHPAMLAFLSPKGVITRYSLDVGFEVQDLRKALVEAGQGTVGSPVDQILLWCFSFDPSSNSYVPQAWKIMRAGGATVVVLLLVCLTPYWIGSKRNPGNGQTALDPDDSTDPELSNSQSPNSPEQLSE